MSQIWCRDQDHVLLHGEDDEKCLKDNKLEKNELELRNCDNLNEEHIDNRSRKRKGKWLKDRCEKGTTETVK